MPDRREFLVGALAVGSLGVAEWLRPREYVRLFAGAKLEEVVPSQFDRWREYPGSGIITPETPGSLADRLYSATLPRIYVQGEEPVVPPVMLLIAYGGEQSDLLQLHRPESCYPAVGLDIVERKPGLVPVGAGGVPATFLTASGQDRVEDIVYWTRLGEALPRTAGEQRNDRLRAAMRGQIGDGMLVRASSVRVSDRPNWPLLTAFLSDLMAAIPAPSRKGFIGSALASQLPS